MIRTEVCSKKAFTLVELLIVICIVAILSTIAVIAYQNITVNSRDTKRKSDLQNIQRAVGLYQHDPNNGNSTAPNYNGPISQSNILATSLQSYLGVPCDPALSTSDCPIGRSASGVNPKYGYFYYRGDWARSGTSLWTQAPMPTNIAAIPGGCAPATMDISDPATLATRYVIFAKLENPTAADPNTVPPAACTYKYLLYLYSTTAWGYPANYMASN